jgi:hypothetical protein
MPVLLRNVLAVIAGLVAGAFINGALITLSPLIIPPPAGVDVSNVESMRQGMHLYQPQHFVMPFLAHALGTFAGALVAWLVAATYKAQLAYAVGVLFLMGGVAAAFMIPAPAWFIALDLLLAYVPMAWLAIRTGARTSFKGRPAHFVLLALLFTACGGDGGQTAQDPPADTLPQAEVPLTPGGATAVPTAAARHFDAGSIQVGERFRELVLVESEVTRVFDDSVWAGRVRFAGEITVAGVYQRHFDWPEPAALCFHVDASSADAVPAFKPDSWTSPNAKVWFCFTNEDAVRTLLGSGETPRHATIVVDDYTVRREFSDVYDTARLVRVASPP